jgi:cytochrome P450
MSSTPASTDADSLPFPLPRPAGRPFDPPSEFLRFQHERPAAKIRLWSGDDAWLFTRYDDVRQVLSDPRLSSDARHPKFPHESPGLVAHRKHQRMLITMDPPEHTQLRRVLARNFVVRELEKLRPNIQRIADELVDEMAAMEQPVDFVAAFALPLPALAISGFLGVPP